MPILAPIGYQCVKNNTKKLLSSMLDRVAEMIRMVGHFTLTTHGNEEITHWSGPPRPGQEAHKRWPRPPQAGFLQEFKGL